MYMVVYNNCIDPRLPVYCPMWEHQCEWKETGPAAPPGTNERDPEPAYYRGFDIDSGETAENVENEDEEEGNGNE
jgi:hypothetical protein